METTTAPETAGSTTTSVKKPRRSHGLVGNRMVLAGAILSLCEFVGIIGTGVHTMPATSLLSASGAHAMYAGQAGAAGFLVGWYALVLPGRILMIVALRRALLDSDRTGWIGAGWRTAMDWAVGLATLGVVVELARAAVDAAAAAVLPTQPALVPALDRVAGYLEAAIYCPGSLATLVLGVAMWRSGVFPRVLVALIVVPAAIMAVGGALLTGPSAQGTLEALTIVNLLGFVTGLWTAILVFVRTPKRAPVAGQPSTAG